ncbi:hypothetical protein [Pseudoflavonifractor capillosus]|uniref:DUF5666 domain-containing protein n=1 Tax=Pseudoflavonifractor capillosus TaxID=106588 RepID=A0A921MLJ3_9FIRM|nr:hypothetical protein [Pseudoflavonifractor capillosus]HJG86044.1 hypothetical protein [Pseudoflavonifractor capillosus]
MRQYTKRLSILLTALLCIGLLAGCGTDTSDNTVSDDSTDTPVSTDGAGGTDSTDDTSGTDGTDSAGGGTDAGTADLIGEITYVGDSYIRINLYEPDTEIADYTDLGAAVLTDTGTSETVTLDTDAVFEYVSSGILYSTTADGLTVGDMVAVTTTEDGIQEIIVLEYSPAGNPDTETDGSAEGAGEDGSGSSDAPAEPTDAPSDDSGDSTLVTSAA